MKDQRVPLLQEFIAASSARGSGCASQQNRVAKVRFGSEADIEACPRNVRFTHAHRLLTAAPVSLEHLHLCCKGSCEFVEKLAPHCPVEESSSPLDFLILEKIRNRFTVRS
jgi:hypothetical protein